MIPRTQYFNQLSTAIRRSPVTALLGPRQCGKTTLAGYFCKGKDSVFFDLESQPDLQRLQNPEFVLGSMKGLVVLDEIQIRPELFGTLRVLADRPNHPARFLILGSASPQIVRNASETLAGRIEFIDLAGFDFSEIHEESIDKLWVRGGFPRSFLADSDSDSFTWREGFIRTFLERDIPQLGITIPAATIRRFWTMLAHHHGQIWNASELARSMGMSDKTVRSYLDILTGTYMVRQLQPWYTNVGKRQVKAPKIYLRDSGLLHNLLSLTNQHDLLGHPKLGASWEGFAIEQIIRIVKPVDAYFWHTHSGPEIDLLIFHNGKPYGFEVKFNEAPIISRSMKNAISDLNLEHLWIISPGKVRYDLDETITVLPIQYLTTKELGRA